MNIRDSVAFVTGANRGLGRAFAQALLAGGARKVYAAARNPSSIDLPGVVPVALDVTDPEQVAAAARSAGDVTLLINNAGISRFAGLLADDSLDALQAEYDTNVLGPLRMARAFTPALKANGGGAIVNVLSVLSWIVFPQLATYSVSKAAAWGMTNGLRNDLRDQGIQVVGLHVGLMDTDMARGMDAPKTPPQEVVRQVLEVLQAGGEEVLADDVSRQVKAGLSAGAYLMTPALGAG